MAANKMDEILKHIPDLEDGWKEMEEKLNTEPTGREMLSLKYRQMLERERLKENLPESEFTKAKREESDSKVMETNAPEKIYLVIDPVWGSMSVNYNRNDVDNIEYIRTDVFIEKAKKFISDRVAIPFKVECCDGEPLADSYAKYASERLKAANKMIEDFVNYIKGE